MEPYLLVTEYLEQGSLRGLLKQSGGLTPEQAQELASDIFIGLVYLHGKRPKMIHRDLKPENILLVQEQRMRAKIAGALFSM